MNAIPLEDLKAHLNMKSSSNDDELQDILDAAETWVERYLNVPLAAQSQTYTVAGGSRVLVLPAMYVQAVTAVTDPYGRPVVGFTANLDAGLVELPYPAVGQWSVAVTQTGSVPADVRLAVLIIAAHLWETQRGAAAVGPLQDADVDAPVGAGFAIPNRAQSLLESYRVPVVS